MREQQEQQDVDIEEQKNEMTSNQRQQQDAHTRAASIVSKMEETGINPAETTIIKPEDENPEDHVIS